MARSMRRSQVAINYLVVRWALVIALLLLIQQVEGESEFGRILQAIFNFGTPTPTAPPLIPTISPTQIQPITATPSPGPTSTSNPTGPGLSPSKNPSVSPSRSPMLYGVCSRDADCPGRFVCFTNQTKWVDSGDSGVLFNCGCPRGRVAQDLGCALRDPPFSDPISIWGILLLIAAFLESLSYGHVILNFRSLNSSDVTSSTLFHSVVSFFICSVTFALWLALSLACDASEGTSVTFLDDHKYCDVIKGEIATGIISAVACMNGMSHSLCFWRRSANRRNDDESLLKHGRNRRDALLVNLITGLLGFGFVTPFSIYFPRLAYWALLPFKVFQCLAMFKVFWDLQNACNDDQGEALGLVENQIDNANPQQDIVSDQVMALIKKSPPMSHRNLFLKRVVKAVGILYSLTVIAAVICFQRMMDNYSFEYTDDKNGSRYTEIILKLAQTLLMLALQALNRYQKRTFDNFLKNDSASEGHATRRSTAQSEVSTVAGSVNGRRSTLNPQTVKSPPVTPKGRKFPKAVFTPAREWPNLEDKPDNRLLRRWLRSLNLPNKWLGKQEVNANENNASARASNDRRSVADHVSLSVAAPMMEPGDGGEPPSGIHTYQMC